MEQSGYYSSDSTSWMSGGRYGTGMYFSMNRIQQLSIHTPAWKKYIEEKKPTFLELRERFNIELNTKDYNCMMWLGCVAYNKLNKYINNKYFKDDKSLPFLIQNKP